MCECFRDPWAPSLLQGCDLGDLALALPLQPTFPAPSPSLPWASTISTLLQTECPHLAISPLHTGKAAQSVVPTCPCILVSQSSVQAAPLPFSTCCLQFFSSWTGRHRVDQQYTYIKRLKNKPFFHMHTIQKNFFLVSHHSASKRKISFPGATEDYTVSEPVSSLWYYEASAGQKIPSWFIRTV